MLPGDTAEAPAAAGPQTAAMMVRRGGVTAEHSHHPKLLMCTQVLAPPELTRSFLCREELEAASQGKDLFAEDW